MVLHRVARVLQNWQRLGLGGSGADLFAQTSNSGFSIYLERKRSAKLSSFHGRRKLAFLQIINMCVSVRQEKAAASCADVLIYALHSIEIPFCKLYGEL